MAPPPAEEGDGKRSSVFRCVRVARKLVACAVALLIVAVSVYAAVMALRAEQLVVSIVGGSVAATGNSRSPPVFIVHIVFDNDGGRATIYYTGVTGVLRDYRSASASTGQGSHVAEFRVDDIVVKPHSWWESYIELDNVTAHSYGEMFSSRNHSMIIRDAALTLNGNLTTKLYSLYNRTSIPTTYYCGNITVGAYTLNDDVAAHSIECQKSAADTFLLDLWVVIKLVSLWIVCSTVIVQF